MGIFLIGILVFLGTHSISIVNEPWRDRMVDRIGLWPWKGLYSLVALVGVILMIWGYQIVRYESAVLYIPSSWQQYLSLLLLLPVFPLLVAAYFPGRIKVLTGHPMLLSVKFWAVAHLFATGSFADVILFASFLGWAVLDLISLQHRQSRPVPEAPASRFNDIIACGTGIGFYLAFVFWLHHLLIGVSPL